MPAIVLGQIVVVGNVVDQAGRNPKDRPVVIISNPNDPENPDTAAGVAISRQYHARPAELCVKLPWQRSRHPRTQLRDDCAAICDWIVEFNFSEIRKIGGRVPDAELNRILQIVSELS